MSLAVALFIGLLQGISELFPVSSLGHAVVVPRLLHLDFDQSSPSFVPFLVLLHLGTAAALLVIYRHDWVRIVSGFVRAAVRGDIRAPEERLSVLIVVATVPTGLVGFLFEKRFKSLFASPTPAAIFLCVNAVILLGAELLRRRDERRRVAAGEVSGDARVEVEEAYRDVEGLSVRSAILIGACQAFALFPGISRAGITLAGGLVGGLRHEEALRFSFLLATPIILAAGLFEVPELANSGVPIGTYLAGTVVAALAAYGSARFLIRYFRVGRLEPYAAYCALLGGTALVFAR